MMSGAGANPSKIRPAAGRASRPEESALSSAPQRPASRSLAAGIFLIASSAIVFEITLTKIFSVTLWYHFAYFVVSIAMFGLGAGGLVVFFLRGRLGDRLSYLLPTVGLIQFCGILACQLFISNVDMSLSLSLADMLGMLYLYILCSVPFVSAGAALSLVFAEYWRDVPRLYAADLAGSALGCVIFLLLIENFQGPSVSVLSAIMALGSAAAFGLHVHGTAGFARRTALHVIIALITLIAAFGTPIMKIKYSKEFRSEGNLLFEKWSALARITVFSGLEGRTTEKQSAFGWGLSRTYSYNVGLRQLWIDQDSSAGTPITEFSGDFAEVEHLRYDITSLPYHTAPDPGNVFIVGAGGGRDVLTALMFGAGKVQACDINPVTISLVRDRFNDFAGGIYRDPRVEPVVAEARSRLRASDESFDLIQISLIDSWSATVAGAFSLAENNLYTREAFVEYLDHLTDEGMISISRFLFRPRTQTLRLVVLARAALEATGVEDPSRHVVVLGTDDTGASTVLISKNPFTEERLARVRATADEYQYVKLHMPGEGGEPEFEAALARDERFDEFIRTAYYDYRAPTDDRPFFFQMLYFTRAFDLFRPGKRIVGQSFNYYGQVVLLELLGISALMVALFFFVPLKLSRRVGALPARWGLYYVLLGAGFMFVEIPLLQKGALYLGHPTYSLSVVLFSMLLFTGAGSALSNRISDAMLPRRLPLLLAVVGGGSILTAFGLDLLISATIGLPFAARAALMTLVSAALALSMGVGFPSGVRMLGPSADRAIPWVWALNGGASVMGSIIAMALSMAFGYRLTLLLGGGAYLAAALTAAQSRIRTT